VIGGRFATNLRITGSTMGRSVMDKGSLKLIPGRLGGGCGPMSSSLCKAMIFCLENGPNRKPMSIIGLFVMMLEFMYSGAEGAWCLCRF